MISVDKPQVVKQRRDIEQLRIEFEILADALHCAEHKNADGVVVQHLSFMLPYEFGGFARDLAIGNLDARKNGSHFELLISVSAILPDGSALIGTPHKAELHRDSSDL
jgi:hypothetical protein